MVRLTFALQNVDFIFNSSYAIEGSEPTISVCNVTLANVKNEIRIAHTAQQTQAKLIFLGVDAIKDVKFLPENEFAKLLKNEVCFEL